jgi:hypothetical protein
LAICSIDLAKQIIDGNKDDKDGNNTLNLPPRITYLGNGTAGVKYSQTGGRTVFERVVSIEDPENQVVTLTLWSSFPSTVAVFTKETATRVKVTITLTNEMTTANEEVRLIARDSANSSSVFVVPVQCVCGCPIGKFIPTTSRALLGAATPLSFVLCGTAQTTVRCKFGTNVVSGGFNVTTQMATCTAPVLWIGQSVELRASADGGSTFPFVAQPSQFTFSPVDETHVRLAQPRAGDDGIIPFKTAELCDPDVYCDSNTTSPFLAPYENGVCFLTRSGPRCAANYMVLDTTVPWSQVNSPSSWNAARGSLESALGKLIGFAIPEDTCSEQEQVIVSIIQHESTPSGDLRISFFAFHDNSSLSPVAIREALDPSCNLAKYQYHPKYGKFCTGYPPQVVNTEQSSSGNALSGVSPILIVVFAVVLGLLIVVLVVVFRPKREAKPAKHTGISAADYSRRNTLNGSAGKSHIKLPRASSATLIKRPSDKTLQAAMNGADLWPIGQDTTANAATMTSTASASRKTQRKSSATRLQVDGADVRVFFME